MPSVRSVACVESEPAFRCKMGYCDLVRVGIGLRPKCSKGKHKHTPEGADRVCGRGEEEEE